MDNQLNQYDNGNGYNNGGQGNRPGGNGDNGGQTPKRPNMMLVILAGLICLTVVLLLYNNLFNAVDQNEVSYSQFLT